MEESVPTEKVAQVPQGPQKFEVDLIFGKKVVVFPMEAMNLMSALATVQLLAAQMLTAIQGFEIFKEGDRAAKRPPVIQSLPMPVMAAVGDTINKLMIEQGGRILKPNLVFPTIGPVKGQEQSFREMFGRKP